MTVTKDLVEAGASSEASASPVCARCKTAARDRKNSSYCKDCRNLHAAEYRQRSRPRPSYEQRICCLPGCPDEFTWCSMRPKQLYCSKAHYTKAREDAKRALRTPPQGLLKCSHCAETKLRADFPPSRQDNLLTGVCTPCTVAYDREWSRQNKERRSASTRRSRSARLLRKYGAPSGDLDALVVQQDNRCYLCGDVPDTAKGFHIDHDHELHEIGLVSYRGLACHGCNTGIGALSDDPERMIVVAERLGARKAELRAAAEYLESHAA